MEVDGANNSMDVVMSASPPLSEMTSDEVLDGEDSNEGDNTAVLELVKEEGESIDLNLDLTPQPVVAPVLVPTPVPAPVAVPVPVPAPEVTMPQVESPEPHLDINECKVEPEDMAEETSVDGLEDGISGGGGMGGISVVSVMSGRGVKRDGSSSEPDDALLQPPTKKRSEEVEKLWRNVHLNPNDFQAWTLLLQHIDQVSDLMSGREAYDGFFERYPYCYGYWKKYADLERRKGSRETTLKVFERGLEAISLSVDLWLHYLEYIASQYPDSEPFVRQEYERAIKTCGLEFKSDKVWEAYLGWESGGKRWKNVTLLYERLLATPTSKYLTHWQKFQEHVKRHLPSEVVGVDEFLSLRREVLSSLSRSDGDAPDEAPPGVEAAPGDELIGTNDEETKALQKSIVSARQKIHDSNIAAVKALWGYEDAIKRPYFHVKPLEKSQLQAWRNYLDYEMKQGDPARIRVLFERCLIACAFYEEFWMRYVRYLEEGEVGEEAVRGVYQRACTIHLREKHRPHMAWAAFEEEKGNPEKSLEILSGIQERVVGGLEAWVQAAGVERRRGSLDDARNTFSRCLSSAKGRNDKPAHSHTSLKYARFLSIFCEDAAEGVEILKAAHEFDKENSSVVLALVDQLLWCRPPQLQGAGDTLKAAVEDTSHQPGTRLLFAHRLFHFLSECGASPSSMSEGLRVLRQVQMEVRQMGGIGGGDNDADNSGGGGGGAGKQGEAVAGGIAVVESRRDKRSQDKGSPSPVNGSGPLTPTSNPPTSAPPTTAAPPPGQAAMVSGYQGYQQSGYGNYNQGYPQGYGASHYQGWGYPAQQGGYGYGQQGWGTYGNYYGQR